MSKLPIKYPQVINVIDTSLLPDVMLFTEYTKILDLSKFVEKNNFTNLV